MTATKETLSSLPPLQRRMADAWLTRFEDAWHAQKLAECMQALPSQSILRRPLLLAMIERDMAHHWQEGRSALVENYLQDYPELGSVDEIPIELIAAEYQLRQKHTSNADLSEFAERFPSRIDELYLLLKPGLFDAPPQAAAAPSEDRAKKRLKLLQAPPAGPLPENGTADRLTKLLTVRKEESHLPEQVPISSPTAPTPPDLSDETAGSVDLFDTPESPQAPEPHVPVKPVESVWLDVEKLRDQSKPPAEQPSAPQPFATPRSFGRYVIERKIAEGSQAVICEGRDTELERRVVIKVPNYPLDKYELARALFYREARAAATVFHPSLCPIYDLGQIDNLDYLTMPYVEGEPLSQVLVREPAWPPRQSVYLILKIAAALDVAHRQGVVHRDLRPSHILLTPSEIPVIVGFGRAGRPQRYDDPLAAAFVAPELLSDQNSGGPRSDIYSLGVMLHQLLTGRLPGQASAEEATDITPKPEMDNALQAVIRKASAPKPEDRYGSMRDLILELNNYMKTTQSVADLSLPLGQSHLQRLTPSATGVPGADPGSATYTQMSELRKLSSSVTPTGKPAPVPYYRRQKPWLWYAASAVAGAILMLTVLTLSSNFSKPKDAQSNNQGNGPQPDPVKVPPKDATIQELVGKLMSSPDGATRENTARRIKERKNSREDIAWIQDQVAEDRWAEDSDAEIARREALVLAIKSIHFEHLLPAIEKAASAQSTKSDQVRMWAIREAADYGVADKTERRWRAILHKALLDDPSNEARILAARSLRTLEVDEETEKVLVQRITDDNWKADGAAAARVDPSRVEALQTLSDLYPERVKEALNAAKRSRNPKVRGWAFEAYREKFTEGS